MNTIVPNSVWKDSFGAIHFSVDYQMQMPGITEYELNVNHNKYIVEGYISRNGKRHEVSYDIDKLKLRIRHSSRNMHEYTDKLLIKYAIKKFIIMIQQSMID